MDAEKQHRDALAGVCLSVALNQRELRDSLLKMALSGYSLVRCMANGVRLDDDEACAQNVALLALADFNGGTSGGFMADTALDALQWLQDQSETALALAMFSCNDLPPEFRGLTATRTVLAFAITQRLLAFAATHPERLGVYLDVAREEMRNTTRQNVHERFLTLQADVQRIGNERLAARRAESRASEQADV